MHYLKPRFRFCYGGDGRATNQRADERSRVAVRHVRSVHYSSGSGAYICLDDFHLSTTKY